VFGRGAPSGEGRGKYLPSEAARTGESAIRSYEPVGDFPAGARVGRGAGSRRRGPKGEPVQALTKELAVQGEK